MAFNERIETRTYISGSAVTQFRFVTLAADGQVDHTGAGQAVTVAYDGRVTVKAAGTIARGGAVASDANGEAVAAASTDIILGYALEAGVDNQIITVELSRAETAAA